MRRIFTDTRQYLVDWILRLSLAFALIYAAFLGFFHSPDWIGYFPNILREHFPDAVILNFFGLSELIIAAWLLWGCKLFIPSVIASIYLLGSIVFNFNQLDILFRNVPILGVAVALAILSYPRIISEI